MRFWCYLIVVIGLLYQADAYVIQTDRNARNRIVQVRWSENQARSGIGYRVNMTSFPFPSADVLRVMQQSFAAWQEVPTAYIAFTYLGTTTIPASTTDRNNVILYDASGTTIGAPAGAGVIAITRVQWNENGNITDADIVFNGRDFEFSAEENNTPSGLVDLQDVMTHEIGHLLGLDHTPLVGAPTVRPTMNPFNTASAPRIGRTLEHDDRAGVTALYAQGNATGGIAGQIVKPDGSGAFGVHVVVYQPGTSVFVASGLSGSTGSMGPGGDGRYEILGLPPGDYQVAIEPHHASISHANFSGIFNHPFDGGFTRKYYNNATGQNAAQTLRVSAGQIQTGIDFFLGPNAPGAPIIADVQVPANTPDPNGPYRFFARVTDDKGVTGVALQYRINAGSLVVQQMSRGGADGYQTEIPGQRQGTVVEYRIAAQDADGNQTSYPVQDQPMQRFEVLVFSGSPVAYVALRNAQVLSVIDTGPGMEVARIPTGQTPLSVLMTSDDRYVFIANTGISANAPDNRITVIETATHRVSATILVGDAPLDMALSPDGRLVYVTNSQSRSVSVIDVATLTERISRLSVPTVGAGPYGLAVSADGQRLYTTDIDANQVLVLDASTGAVLARINVVSSPRSLVLSPDGNRLYAAGFDGGIGVVNVQTLAQEQVIDTGTSSIFRLAVSPDGSRVYATDRLNARLLVVDVAQNRVTNALSVLTGGRETRDLFVSPDGGRVYVTNQDSGDLVVFDTRTLQVLRTFRLTDGPRGVAVRTRPVEIASTQEIAQRADFDGDGAVGFGDFLLFSAAFGLSAPNAGFEVRFDLDGDGVIGFSDFLLFASAFGRLVAR